MAHGQPDFGMYSVAATIYRLSDMGELAARLGSICTFDRRGDIIFLDSFESGLAAFHPATSGTGASVGISSEYARNGGFSAKLVAGSDGSRYAEIWRLQPYPVVGKIGLEVSFTMHADVEYVALRFMLYSGTLYQYGGIRYDQDNSLLQYRDSSGTYQTLQTNVLVNAADYQFSTMKLVIDIENNVYCRALLDNSAYDLSEYAIATVASTARPNLGAVFTNWGASGKNATIYGDDFILTQNEP